MRLLLRSSTGSQQDPKSIWIAPTLTLTALQLLHACKLGHIRQLRIAGNVGGQELLLKSHKYW